LRPHTVSAANGDEMAACIAVADRHGYIPWAKLGVPKLDAWGNIFRYSVTPDYAGPAGTLVLSPPTARDITIQTRDISGTLINVSTPGNIPAVVLSHGKNGYLIDTDSDSVDELVTILETLMADPEKKEQIAHESIETFYKTLKWENQIQLIKAEIQ